MNDELRPPDYLGHNREAIERIFRYTENIDEAAFVRNEMVQDAVIRNIEIVGEASRNIERADPDFVVRHPEMEIKSAIAMRNALSQGYHKVDLEVVWRTIEDNLGQLHARVVEVLRKYSEGQDP